MDTQILINVFYVIINSAQNTSNNLCQIVITKTSDYVEKSLCLQISMITDYNNPEFGDGIGTYFLVCLRKFCFYNILDGTVRQIYSLGKYICWPNIWFCLKYIIRPTVDNLLYGNFSLLPRSIPNLVKCFGISIVYDHFFYVSY